MLLLNPCPRICRRRPTVGYLLALNRCGIGAANLVAGIVSRATSSRGAWLLSEMGMTDGLQQSFPLSQSPLFMPLALEGHTGARAQSFAKVAIAG